MLDDDRGVGPKTGRLNQGVPGMLQTVNSALDETDALDLQGLATKNAVAASRFAT